MLVQSLILNATVFPGDLRILGSIEWELYSSRGPVQELEICRNGTNGHVVSTLKHLCAYKRLDPLVDWTTCVTV